ncbi:MAG: hypothetical protein KZQ97_05990 [Candidatus Thiodiazotropha sp. (ex Dulcina madagascariensis)]|nr:hypothetical protein [Candidatus Thiodiazotropha sp. (ex Dulcina madagascariensis)]
MISKEHTIAEIQRAANENGGKAPGRQVFEKETGIKRSDWNKQGINGTLNI